MYEHVAGLGSATVQQAEMTAVRDALFYLLHSDAVLRRAPIHIFTDSMYTLHASTSAELRRKHFYLAQEIHNVAHRLNKAGCEVWMHYVPSHIERTAAGLRYTGNQYADTLANKGRLLSKDTDEQDFLYTVRERILSLTVEMVDHIDKKIELLSKESDGPPGPPDDLSACAHANRNSFSEGVP